MKFTNFLGVLAASLRSWASVGKDLGEKVAVEQKNNPAEQKSASQVQRLISKYQGKWRPPLRTNGPPCTRGKKKRSGAKSRKRARNKVRMRAHR